MSKRGDEIKAAVNAIINDVPSVQAALIMQVALKLVIDILNDCFETEDKKKSCFDCYIGYKSKTNAVYFFHHCKKITQILRKVIF